MAVPLAFKQLTHDPLRFTVALLGVGFAVLLMLMQLGFRSAMIESALRYPQRLDFDVALIAPQTVFVGLPRPFPRQRLYQAATMDGVVDVSPVYIYQHHFENPWTHESRNLLVVGVELDRVVLRTPGVAEGLRSLAEPDVVLFDALSRPEFGPVGEQFVPGQRIATEIGTRRVEIVGLFELGTSFAIDGNVLTSALNFRRLFPERDEGAIDVGLIRLEPGVDPAAARDAIDARLPGDVEVLTRDDWLARESAYWEATTPIGYVFGFGLVMGLAVGGIIVYQILFADVSSHLAEYATLKAVGYSDVALALVVLRQAAMLAVLGFFPGAVLARISYRLASDAIRMPLDMTLGRSALVLVLTVIMCGVAGLMALRKLAEADPADVF